MMNSGVSGLSGLSRAEGLKRAQEFFRESTLGDWRELKLRQAAHEVEHRMIEGEPSPSGSDGLAHLRKHHKILVWVTGNSKSAMLIRRAKRMGDLIAAECGRGAYGRSEWLTGDGAQFRHPASQFRAQPSYQKRACRMVRIPHRLW